MELANLYEKFLIRDLLGKVAPGLLLLTVIGRCFWLFPRYLDELNFATSLLVYSLSYLVGLAIEFAGTKAGLLSTYVVDGDREDSLRQFSRFLRQPIQNESAAEKIFGHRERFVVLKQVTGNFGVAFLAIGVFKIVAVHFLWHFPYIHLLVPLAFCLLGLLLLTMSKNYSLEQRSWEKFRN